MIRSLYTRVVLIFLISVIGGTLLAFFIASWAFRDQMNENLQLPMTQFAQDIARIYDQMPTEEANEFVGGMNQLDSYYLRIYESTESFRSYGQPAIKEFEVREEWVRQVLAGDTIRVNTNGITIELIGMPFATNEGPRALFVEPVGSAAAPFIIKWLLSFAMYALIAGSLVFVGAAAFVVRPIKQLTRATRHIASGDFDVKLDIRQKGELGELARSFEAMSSDLRRQEEMRRDFVSNVSHEVQSPLTSISGYALALKQSNLSEDQRGRYLDIITAEANRMSRMSDSLLKLSLLESKPQLQRAELRLDEQIRRIIIALQPQWSEKGIRFELDLPVVRMVGDPDQLGQVWTNIIGNAIKFSPDNGEIKVTLSRDAANVAVRIEDRGIVIAPEDQERVFERFFKADRSRSRKYAGSGMGLAIVRQIVSLHRGSIEVESEPGRGTAFTVTLPLDAPETSSDR